MAHRIIHRLAGLACLAASLLAGAALAQQGYPNRPVRVVVPYPPGGPTDTMARVFAQKMSEVFKQSFVVENISGASGMVGTGSAASAAPDGHTLLVVTNDYAVTPAVQSKVNYQLGKSFAPVSLIASTPLVLFVHPSLPVKSLQDLVDLSKKEPDKYSYATMGIGSGLLSAERLFNLGLHLKFIQVPFQGAAPIVTSVLGNQTPIGIIALPPVAPSIKDGGLRALAMTSSKRFPEFPDVPTLEELGVKGQRNDLIIGLLAPGGTPQPIIDRLSAEVKNMLPQPDVQKMLNTLGFTAVGSTPDEFAAQIKEDYESSVRIIKETGLKFE